MNFFYYLSKLYSLIQCFAQLKNTLVNRTMLTIRFFYTFFQRLHFGYRLLIGVSIFLGIAILYFTYVSAQSKTPIKVGHEGNEKADFREDNETELRIVQATPTGTITHDDLKKEIVVVFNHPIVPLAKLEEHTEGVFTVHPPVEGNFRWYGSRVCAFIPKNGFNPGTAYRVEVPKGIRSLDGKVLGKGITFEFKTPSLKILEFSLVRKGEYDSSTMIDYDQSFQIIFNYPVTIGDVEKNVKLRCGPRLHPFKVVRPAKTALSRWYYSPTEMDVERVVIVQPEKSYGRDEKVVLAISKKLVPKGGNSPMEDDFVKEFRTYGPVEVSLEREDVNYFQDLWQMRLNFTNPVRVRDVMKLISFTPHARWRWTDEGTVYSVPLTAWTIKPGTKYTISVAKNFTDSYGNPLRGENRFQIETPSYRPSLYTLSDHVCIEALMAQKIPVDVANLPEVDVRIVSFSLDELAQSIVNRKYSIFSNAKEIASIPWKTNIGPNSAERLGFDFSSYLGPTRRGWVGLKFSAKVPSYYRGTETVDSYTLYVQSTDLGMTIKQGVDRSIAWVHSLTNGNPIKGVRVRAYEGGKKVAECVTDSEGSCSMNTAEIFDDEKAIFVAESSNGVKDQAFVTARDHSVYMFSLADYSSEKREISVRGIIVFDRKLYRPGDEVNFKAAIGLWKAGEYIPVQSLGGKAIVKVRNAEGETFFEKIVDITEEGGVFDSFAIPKDSPLGHYSLYVIPKGLSERSGQYLYDTFQVEEFRPVSFSVQTKGIDNSRVNAKLHCEVEGKYLFGAPMQNAPVQLTIRRRPISISSERFAEYLFGDEVYLARQGNAYEYVAGAEGKTNFAGVFPYQLMLTPMTYPESDELSISVPYQLEIEARVTDVDQKSVTNVSSCVVFAGEFIFGIRTNSPYQHYQKGFAFDLVALGNDGKGRGVADAQLIIHREEVKSIQSKGPGDSRQMQNIRTAKLVHREDLKLSEIPHTCTFKPESAGTYIITVKEKRGLSASRMIVHAWGGDFGGWDVPNDDVVKLIADKNEYRPGETARVLVQSPFPKARAIVTLERENVIWKKSMVIGNDGKPLEIPIKSEYMPNVYLSVMLITSRTKELPIGINKQRLLVEDLGIPRFKIGILKLNVNTSTKRARLEISTDKSQYTPRDTVEVEIVSEPNAEVSLSVADRGVLDLVNYHYPDPVRAFYNEWPLFVRAIENRRFLVQQLVYALKGNAPGGGDGEGDTGFGGFHFDGEDGTRKNFKYTAFWNPSIKTDAEGKARVRFILPDNLTTFRVFALACAKGKYATREHEFFVRTPLVVQPIVPRIIRPGDELEIGAVVINQTSRNAEFEVTIASPHLVFNQKQQREARRIVFIAKGASKEVSFVARLDEKAYVQQKYAVKGNGILVAKGIVRCEMKAKGDAGTAKDQVAFSLPIREHPPTEAFTIAGFTDEKISEGIKIPSREEVMGELGGLEISLASTALSGLQKAFNFYHSNPYFCIEQRASAFLCAITSGELLQRFRYKPKEGEGYDFSQIKEFFLDSLHTFQNSDGGFSFWSDSSYRVSNPYLTAYVTFVLQYARQRGFQFNEEIYRKALDYLVWYVRRPLNEPEQAMFENFALIYQVLAKEKKDVRDLERVLLQNEHALSLRAKANFALGLAEVRRVNRSNSDKDISRLIEDIKSRMDFTTRAVSFRELPISSLGSSLYSKSSTLGVLLRLFMKVEPGNPVIPQIVRFAIDDKACRWWNESHGVGNLALALFEYAKKYEKGDSDFTVQVKIGTTRIVDEILSARSNAYLTKIIRMSDLFEIADPKGIQPFEFAIVRGKGRLYYTATLHYSPTRLDAQPRDEGIEVRKEIFRMKTGAKGELTLEQSKSLMRGEMYLCRITVINPKPYFNFLINDSLPSNVEAVKSSFATESAAINRFVQQKRGENTGWWFEQDFDRYELRDDRVVISRDYLAPGIHEFYYLARPLVKGKSTAQGTHAFLMYAPEVFGKTASDSVEVR